MKSLIRLRSSSGGRIGRGGLWLNGIVISVVLSAVGFVLIALGFSVTVSGIQITKSAGGAAQTSRFFETMLAPVPSLILSAIWAIAFAAPAVKRRHDRGSPGWDALAILAVGVVLQLLAALHVQNALTSLVGLAASMGGIYLLVVLGFLKGTAGANNYGPDPLQG